MYEDMRVKYLYINRKYPAYLKSQVALVIGWLIGSGLFCLFAGTSDMWLLKNAWWLCLVVGGLEVLETLGAIRKAKKDYRANCE